MNQFTDLNQIFLKNQTKDSLVKTINEKYAGECDDTLTRADRLLRGDILFQNAWDMERTQEIVSMPLSSIDWNYSPTPDLEFSFMLHRHGYLMDVLVAYIFTNDDKYIQFLNDFLIQYVKENKYSKLNELYSWRTIDVAIRLVNLVRINEVLHILDIKLDESVYVAMEDYYNFIIERLEYRRYQSNWSAIESSAAIAYAVAFNTYDERFDKALDAYDTCLDLQVLNDGLQWEQSFMYHHEVLITALFVNLALQDKTPEAIRRESIKLYEASLKIMRPDFMQINFGDSDYESMASIMLASEKIFKTHSLKQSVESSLYDFLLTGDSSDYVSEEVLKVEKIHLEEAGIAFVKDHQQNTSIMFSNGPLGGGHGHDDLLHIDWMVNGKNFLIDSGRYTYYEENGSRLYFKRPQAHNTIVVDDQSYNKHIDSWASEKVATVMNDKVIFKDKVSLFEGGHLGYSDDELMTYVNRKVIYTDDNVGLVVDEIKSNQERTLTSNFIYNTHNVEIKDHLIRYEDDGLTMNLHILSEEASITKKDAIVSFQYNEQHDTSRIEVSEKLKQGSILTLIADDSITNVTLVDVYDTAGNKYEKEIVQCVKFIKNNQQYYILVQHEEPRDSRTAYVVEDEMIYGRVVYFEKHEGKRQYIQKIY